MDPEPAGDLLFGRAWECAHSPPGALAGPDVLEAAGLDWLAASVPGTAAGARAAAGFVDFDSHPYDDDDWWFRCRFDAADGTGHLRFEGLATVADVWLNGVHLLHSENMFRATGVDGPLQGGANELVIRFAALAPRLAERRSRPRWKSYMVTHQNLRWFRTSLLGRIPGWAVVPVPVGPWRPVRLHQGPDPAPRPVRLVASCAGDDGIVEATIRLPATVPPGAATLVVAGVRAPFERAETAARAEVRVPGVERWWPHTHGAQPLYDVAVELEGTTHRIGRVGFRTLRVDRTDAGFQLLVNDEPVFCRGACWLPPDPLTLAPPRARVDHLLDLAAAAHMNMLRVPGTGTFEDDHFFERCDELGILVWQDCMFAFLDPPEDEAFEESVTAELRECFDALSGHPALAVVCGNQEVEEIAAMNGLPAAAWRAPLFDKTVPMLVEAHLPGVPYVSSNPTGGQLPFQMDAGVSQYFGVGGYLRPPEDARRAGVRFAAECLAFSTPPEPRSMEEHCGGATRAGHDPTWKTGVHHDAGRSWDMEDVRHYYQRLLFGTDPLLERYVDPEHALDLGRATNAELMSRVFAEWRRAGSTCAGGLVLALADLRHGAGWGVVDFAGRPKAPWFALRRAFAPVTVLVTDEGLNGLRLTCRNDTAHDVAAVVRVDLFAKGEAHVEGAAVDVVIPARGALALDAAGLFEGFRDISYAYRFGPPSHDVVAVTLADTEGRTLAETVYLPGGQQRATEHDVGLAARLDAQDAHGLALEVSTRRFAQWVSIDAPGWRPADSWFHLAPGATRRIELSPESLESPVMPPVGTVRSINSTMSARFVGTRES
jgi:beta-mannosidase